MVRTVLCTVVMALAMTAAMPAWANPHDVHSRHALHAHGLSRHYVRHARMRAPAPMTRQRPQPVAQQFPARVYLLRGFMNIFSLGIDDLGAKIQADGIAATVANHADAEIFLKRIVSGYQAGDRGPIILIGHSLGADAVIAMAQALDRQAIPVALAILFDGTAPHEVPGNVNAAINFTQQFEISPGPGFTGTLANVDLRGQEGIDHFTIDKIPALQARALDAVLQASSAPARH